MNSWRSLAVLRIIETASSDVKIVHSSGLDKLLIIPAGDFKWNFLIGYKEEYNRCYALKMEFKTFKTQSEKEYFFRFLVNTI